MANKFKEKQYMAECLAELYEIVSKKEKAAHCTYGIIGTTNEQAVDWQTQEPLWEDEEHTIPKMKAEWGDIVKTDEELTDDDRAKIAALNQIMAMLEKLL